jgi:hypothetical protein
MEFRLPAEGEYYGSMGTSQIIIFNKIMSLHNLNGRVGFGPAILQSAALCWM